MILRHEICCKDPLRGETVILFLMEPYGPTEQVTVSDVMLRDPSFHRALIAQVRKRLEREVEQAEAEERSDAWDD